MAIPATTSPAIAAISVGDALPNATELTGPASADWMPVMVGSARIGTVTSTRPPPARNPARPVAHDDGLANVATNADAIPSRQPRRSAGVEVTARCWLPATLSGSRAARARP